MVRQARVVALFAVPLLILTLVVLVRPTPATPSSTATSDEGDPRVLSEYVALGDSFTAGPGLPFQRQQPAVCRRSSSNYPSQVAEKLGIRLKDVSCGGARQRDLDRRQQLRDGTSTAPQFDALTRGTDLVTLGLGANEFGIFARIFVGCLRLSDADRSRGQEQPCRDAATERRDDKDVDTMDRDARRVEAQIRRALAEIGSRAPYARVLVVGYPRMVPNDRGCRLLPFSASDARWIASVWARVNDSLLNAATAEGAEFVDVSSESARHHACSRRAWINGPRDGSGDGTGFHPNPRGMAEMTRLVLNQIKNGQ